MLPLKILAKNKATKNPVFLPPMENIFWNFWALRAHMGAAEISAGGAKKFFQRGRLQKQTRKGDYFQNLGYG